MASIFRNSHLVLSATGSSDAYGGLYASFPSDFTEFALRVNTCTNEVFPREVDDLHIRTDGTGEIIYVRRSFPHPHSDTSNRYANDLPLLPTLRRGWIFQERFLSPRVLHFNPQELYFECLDGSTCQCTSYSILEVISWAGFEYKSQAHSIIYRQKPKMYFDPSIWRRIDRNGLVFVWHRLVHDYTQLELTYEKDLFPAISGLAREMSITRAARNADEENVQETEYFAGLWKDSLVRDLCWKVDYDKHPMAEDYAVRMDKIKTWMERPREWRALTWSWGSVNASVKFLGQGYGVKDFFEPLCEALHISCTTAGPDKMGELKAGKLVLHGQLFPAKVITIAFWTLPAMILSLNLGVKDDRFLQELYVDDGCQDLSRLLHDMETAGHQPIVYCFLLGIIRSTESPVFLLLKKGKGEPEVEMGQTVYERFGRLQLNGPPRRPENDKTPWKERFGVFAQAKEEVVTII